MAYTVNFTNGSKLPINVANNVVNTTTDIGLVGQGLNNYGEIVAEDLLHLMENFANDVAPSKPVEGQLWYNSDTNQLNYFDDTVANSGNWKPIASMTVAASEPSGVGESDGHFWIDSDDGTLYIQFNSNWIPIANTGTVTRAVSRQRYDTTNTLHETLEFIVNGEIVTIVSSDLVDWTPQTAGVNTEYLEDGSTLLNTQFATISPGQNMNSTSGYLFSGIAVEALYADVAERYHADQPYEYGVVVRIGGAHEITQTLTEYDTEVFGVISQNPALRMNAGAGSDETHPFVAMTGRTPVKVIGPVTKGERLVSSNTPGHAQGAGHSLPLAQATIGRALESKAGNEAGIVEAVIGVK